MEDKVWGFVDLREGSAGSTVTVNGGSYTGSTCASDSYHYTALFTVGSESKLVLNNVSAETDERVVKASSCGEVVVSGGTYNITGINAFLGAAFETKTASFTDMKLTAKYGGCVQVGRNATLENCEIKVTDIRTGDGTYLNCAVAVQYGGTATVKSGTYTARMLPMFTTPAVRSTLRTVHLPVLFALMLQLTQQLLSISKMALSMAKFRRAAARAARPSPSPAARSALIRARRSRTTDRLHRQARWQRGRLYLHGSCKIRFDLRRVSDRPPPALWQAITM